MLHARPYLLDLLLNLFGLFLFIAIATVVGGPLAAAQGPAADRTRVVTVKLDDLRERTNIKTVRLAQGDRLVVLLESNRSTGADWTEPKFDDKEFRKVEHWSADPEVNRTRPPGAPDGYEIYVFEVLHPQPQGKALKFQWGQSFNPDSMQNLEVKAADA